MKAGKNFHFSKTSLRYFLRTFSIILLTIVIPFTLVVVPVMSINYRSGVQNVLEQQARELRQLQTVINQALTEINAWHKSIATNSRALFAMNQYIRSPLHSHYVHYYVSSVVEDYIRIPSGLRNYVQETEIHLKDASFYLSSKTGMTAEPSLPDSQNRHEYSLEVQVFNDPSGTAASSFMVYCPLSYTDASSSSANYIVTKIKYDYILELMQKMTSPNTDLFLLSSSGELLTSISDLIMNETLHTDNWTPDQAQEFSLNGKKYYGFQVPCEFNLKLAMILPVNTASAIVRENFREFSILGISVILSCIAIAFFYSISQHRQVMSIIHYLTALSENQNPEAPEKIGRGEYAYILQNLVSLYARSMAVREELQAVKYEKKIMSLTALQSQINPHFLYNTFDSINWKLIQQQGKPTPVNDMIADLSEILSYSLETPLNMVPLLEEMRVTECYMNIMRQENDCQLSLEWKIQAECMDMQLPRLIFQPLVENCITHGLDGSQQHLNIIIQIWMDHDRIRIQVSDDGCGMSEDTLKGLKEILRDTAQKSARKNIGLRNVSHRLVIIYGTRSRMHIESKPEKGTTVRFSLGVDQMDMETLNDFDPEMDAFDTPVIM